MNLTLEGGTPDIAGSSGSDRDDRKPIGTHTFRLGYGVVSVESKKQTSVSLSTLEFRVYGNVPGGEGDHFAEWAFEGP
jgi:hypothetical protein